MCHHIHRNHTVFVQSIKDKIGQSTLAEHKDDMAVFLQFLQNNLHLISSTGAADTSNNDLIPHILTHLRCSKIPIFQQTILKWHWKYMENKLSLMQSQILWHSNQWVETIDPTISAFQAIAQQADPSVSSQLQSFLANLPRISQLLANTAKLDMSYGKPSRMDQSFWSYYNAPPDITQPRYHNGQQ
jgi:hypothetical protein